MTLRRWWSRRHSRFLRKLSGSPLARALYMLGSGEDVRCAGPMMALIQEGVFDKKQLKVGDNDMFGAVSTQVRRRFAFPVPDILPNDPVVLKILGVVKILRFVFLVRRRDSLS